jgi:hypothetical protein
MLASEAQARASDLAVRRSLLAAVLCALVCRPALACPSFSSSTPGATIGAVSARSARGMRRQGYDLISCAQKLGGTLAQTSGGRPTTWAHDTWMAMQRAGWDAENAI